MKSQIIMKNLYLLVLFSLFIATINSQEKITIVFTDGTEINGYGRIKINEKILFRKNKNAPKETYSYDTERKVKTLIIHNDDADKSYEYKVLHNNGFTQHKLLEIYKIGKVNLYIEPLNASTNPDVHGGIEMSYSYTNYYMAKKNTDTIVDLRQGNVYSRRFRKDIATNFFNDCPDF